MALWSNQQTNTKQQKKQIDRKNRAVSIIQNLYTKYATYSPVGYPHCPTYSPRCTSNPPAAINVIMVKGGVPNTPGPFRARRRDIQRVGAAVTRVKQPGDPCIRQAEINKSKQTSRLISRPCHPPAAGNQSSNFGTLAVCNFSSLCTCIVNMHIARDKERRAERKGLCERGSQKYRTTNYARITRCDRFDTRHSHFGGYFYSPA